MVDNDAISKGVLLGRGGGLRWKMVWPNGVVANRDVWVSNVNKVPSLRHLRKHEHSSTQVLTCGAAGGKSLQKFPANGPGRNIFRVMPICGSRVLEAGAIPTRNQPQERHNSQAQLVLIFRSTVTTMHSGPASRTTHEPPVQCNGIS